jgi:hypothetical protein
MVIPVALGLLTGPATASRGLLDAGRSGASTSQTELPREAAIYCPECAEREFDDSSPMSEVEPVDPLVA